MMIESRRDLYKNGENRCNSIVCGECIVDIKIQISEKNARTNLNFRSFRQQRKNKKKLSL